MPGWNLGPFFALCILGLIGVGVIIGLIFAGLLS